jgi:hypothetical protein
MNRAQFEAVNDGQTDLLAALALACGSGFSSRGKL